MVVTKKYLRGGANSLDSDKIQGAVKSNNKFSGVENKEQYNLEKSGLFY